jgi:hypothetical protein
MIMKPARSVSSESTPCWQRVITARLYTTLTTLSLTLVAGGAQAHPWSWGVCGWGTEAQSRHCNSICNRSDFGNPQYTQLVYACSERVRQQEIQAGRSASPPAAATTNSSPKTPATARGTDKALGTTQPASAHAPIEHREPQPITSKVAKTQPIDEAPASNQKSVQPGSARDAGACNDAMTNCGGSGGSPWASTTPSPQGPVRPWGFENPNQVTTTRPTYLTPNIQYSVNLGAPSPSTTTASRLPPVAPWLDVLGTILFGEMAEAGPTALFGGEGNPITGAPSPTPQPQPGNASDTTSYRQFSPQPQAQTQPQAQPKKKCLSVGIVGIANSWKNSCPYPVTVVWTDEQFCHWTNCLDVVPAQSEDAAMTYPAKDWCVCSGIGCTPETGKDCDK